MSKNMCRCRNITWRIMATGGAAKWMSLTLLTCWIMCSAMLPSAPGTTMPSRLAQYIAHAAVSTLFLMCPARLSCCNQLQWLAWTAVLCCACCAVLCCAVLCCACCAVLCCAVLQPGYKCTQILCMSQPLTRETDTMQPDENGDMQASMTSVQRKAVRYGAAGTCIRTCCEHIAG